MITATDAVLSYCYVLVEAHGRCLCESTFVKFSDLHYYAAYSFVTYSTEFYTSRIGLLPNKMAGLQVVVVHASTGICCYLVFEKTSLLDFFFEKWELMLQPNRWLPALCLHFISKLISIFYGQHTDNR